MKSARINAKVKMQKAKSQISGLLSPKEHRSASLKSQIFLGFTLIEMLVVIAIIGILTTIISAGFIRAQKMARDSQRKSHMTAYRGALELYANANGGIYPIQSPTAVDLDSSCLGLLTAGFLGVCPLDPRQDTDPTNPIYYHYESSASGDKYCVWAGLESENGNFQVCSDGSAGTVLNSPPVGFL